jgi:hypothetical protein
LDKVIVGLLCIGTNVAIILSESPPVVSPIKTTAVVSQKTNINTHKGLLSEEVKGTVKAAQKGDMHDKEGALQPTISPSAMPGSTAIVTPTPATNSNQSSDNSTTQSGTESQSTPTPTPASDLRTDDQAPSPYSYARFITTR